MRFDDRFNGFCPTCGQPYRGEIDILQAALKEIAEEELDEGDPVSDEPTFGARHYVNIARKALMEAREIPKGF